MIGELLKQTERPLESIEISSSSKVVIVCCSNSNAPKYF